LNDIKTLLDQYKTEWTRLRTASELGIAAPAPAAPAGPLRRIASAAWNGVSAFIASLFNSIRAHPVIASSILVGLMGGSGLIYYCKLMGPIISCLAAFAGPLRGIGGAAWNGVSAFLTSLFNSIKTHPVIASSITLVLIGVPIIALIIRKIIRRAPAPAPAPDPAGRLAMIKGVLTSILQFMRNHKVAFLFMLILVGGGGLVYYCNLMEHIISYLAKGNPAGGIDA
jgi:hypothetical protein